MFVRVLNGSTSKLRDETPASITGVEADWAGAAMLTQDGALAIQNRRKHGYAEFREGVREISAPPTTFL